MAHSCVKSIYVPITYKQGSLHLHYPVRLDSISLFCSLNPSLDETQKTLTEKPISTAVSQVFRLFISKGTVNLYSSIKEVSHIFLHPTGINKCVENSCFKVVWRRVSPSGYYGYKAHHFQYFYKSNKLILVHARLVVCSAQAVVLSNTRISTALSCV